MVNGLATLERVNAKACGESAIKKVIVAHCNASDSEAIYVDGVFETADDTIQAHDIVDAVGGVNVPFTLSEEKFDITPLAWPETIELLRDTADRILAKAADESLGD